MRRRAALILIATLATTTLAAVVVAPYVIAERGWRALQTRIEQAIGSRLSAAGPVQGRLWPAPRLIVAGLEATAPGDAHGAPLIYADQAKIQIGWRALLTGHLDSARIHLGSVRLLALPPHPPADIQGVFDSSAATFTASFEGGLARLTLRPEGGGVRLEDIDVRAGQLAASGSGRASFNGVARLVLGFDRVRWSDVDIGRADVAAVSERDGILLERAAFRAPDGGEAALFGLLTTAAGDLRFSGGVDAYRVVDVGRLQAAARLTALFGREAQRVDVDDIDVRLGISRLTGNARLDTAATPRIAADLRADELDVGALDESLAMPLPALLAFSSGNLKLRVGQVAWGDVVAQGVVVDIVHRDRDFELRELAARDIGGSSLQAAGRFVRASDGSFVFNALDFRYGRLEGKGRLAVDLFASPVRIDADVQTGPLALDSLVPAPPPLPAEPLTRRAAMAATRRAQAEDRSWSSESLPWPVLPSIAAELHLAAPSITWRGLRLDVATFAGRLAGGVLVVDQLAGLIYGGRAEISGRAPATVGAAPGFAGKLRLSDLDLRAVLQAYAGLDEIAGRLDAESDLSAVGQSPAQLVASLAGTVRLGAYEGVMDGFDLARMSARLKETRRPADLFEAVRIGLAGRTPFRSLTGTFRVDRGVAVTEDLQLIAAAGEGRTRGNIDLPGWKLDLVNEFRLTEHPDLPPVSLRISGPVDAPRRVFDIGRLQSGLLRRGQPKP